MEGEEKNGMERKEGRKGGREGKKETWFIQNKIGKKG